MKLRKAEPKLERPYKIKYWKTTGILAIVLSALFITLYLPGMPSSLLWPIEWLIVGGWYLIGLALYFIRSDKNSKQGDKEEYNEVV